MVMTSTGSARVSCRGFSGLTWSGPIATRFWVGVFHRLRGEMGEARRRQCLI